MSKKLGSYSNTVSRESVGSRDAWCCRVRRGNIAVSEGRNGEWTGRVVYNRQNDTLSDKVG